MKTRTSILSQVEVYAALHAFVSAQCRFMQADDLVESLEDGGIEPTDSLRTEWEAANAAVDDTFLHLSKLVDREAYRQMVHGRQVRLNPSR